MNIAGANFSEGFSIFNKKGRAKRPFLYRARFLNYNTVNASIAEMIQLAVAPNVSSAPNCK